MKPAARFLGAAVALALALAAVAVAVLVGRGGPAEQARLSAGGTRTVAVTLDDMRITPSRITVPAGTRLVLDVTNTDAIAHDLALASGPHTPLLAPGHSAVLDAGTITGPIDGWCTVPGHRAAGMTMTIALTGTAAPSPGASDAVVNPAAAPGPGWQPRDPALPPLSPSHVHEVTFTVRDSDVEVAPGVRQTLWTYNGTAPGPILHGRVGDEFVVRVVNDGDMAHSIDFHAGDAVPDQAMRPIPPGGSLVYRFTATHSGAWLYHCATMPMSLHIANGMYGAVIIDPPDADHVDRQFVLVQSELYLGPQDGIADETKIQARRPDAFTFNGYVDQYLHAPIQVRAGERIRVWVVDAGPQFGTSFHVVGTQFDTVFAEGAYLLRPDNPEHGAAQTLSLAPAQGGFVEFTLAQPGHYPFLDHAMVDAEAGATGEFAAN